MSRPITDADVALVQRYFRDHGIDPQYLAPEFFLFWIREGKSAAQIFALATNTLYTLESV